MTVPYVPGYACLMSPQAYVSFVRARPELFLDGFAVWLERNPAIWARFKQEADRIRRRRSHYSARTLVEFIRHETALTEADGAFKVNNNAARDLARLYMATTPGAEKFFETRDYAASA
jgi:hypothetical protein